MTNQIYSPKQADYLLHADARMNLLCGAISSGKTHATIDILPKRVATQPEGNCLLVSKTFDTLQRNVLDPARERFGSKYISTIHGSPKHVDIFGRPFYVLGANDERAYRKLQGISLVYALTDELTGYPESFVKWLYPGRLRQKGAIWDATMNPEHQLHHVKTYLIDPPGLDRKVWNFTLDDNPFLDPAYVAETKLMYSGVWYDRLILGKWVAAQGAIYDMFRTELHVVDKAPCELTQTAWLSCDYGTTNPTVFLWVVLGIDGNYYVTDEYTWDSQKEHRQKTDSEYADDLKRFIGGQKIHPQAIIVDPSAASFIAEIRKRGIGFVKPGDNAVLDGIRCTASAFMTGKLLVYARCKGLIDSISGYVWDTKAIEHGQEERPIKQGDHHSDALRYFVFTILRKLFIR